MVKSAYRNEMIKKRRKKRIYKRCILLLILLICISATLCLKLPYFNIKNINVINNSSVTKDVIANLSLIKKGNNIFYVDLNKAKKAILKNPYIEDVNFSRDLPSTIEIIVKERKPIYYSPIDSRFAIIDKNGIVLDIKNDIKGMTLVKLDGVDAKYIKIGQVIYGSDSKKVKTLIDISNLYERADKTAPQITEVDLSDSLNAKVNYSDMCVILGNSFDLENKLNKALNIIVQGNYKTTKGYIDVSFNGNPVVSITK